MMENKLNGLVILLILASSLLTSLGAILPTAKATYVEGEISVDTVWALVDSPFIVAQNVTIKEGVTLTIEPGVEVRFGGGPFTIIVNGTLIARGTGEKPIKFTSGKELPEAGDWATILFNGAGQQPSTLENCVIEYGIDGVTVNSGVLNVQNSIIQLNLRNGVTVLGGSVVVRQSILQKNIEAGVAILGGDAVIRDNSITLNGAGVILAGFLSASNIEVARNQISSNVDSGVLLVMAGSDGGISITENTVSLNNYGFYVSTNATTYITRNYICNNRVGAFYEQGNHTIRFNDIYNNVVGVDASLAARVNATQNYWGHISGPYHESLNPRGKGNSVGGNGVNIDFIFFLTNHINYENSPPTAVLWTDKAVVALGQDVTFVGAYSGDDGRVDKYFFNFGDGYSSGWTTLSLFFHRYSGTGTYNAQLMVMDDFGVVSPASSVTIHVANLSPLNVELTLSSQSVHRNGEVSVTVRVSNSIGPVEGANVTLYSVKGGSFSQSFGLTDSTGVFTATFRAPDVMDVANVRIIARASKEGYADGSGFAYLEVVPPLNVDVAADPSAVLSEESSAINVRVTWNGAPVSGATVTISSSSGGVFAETEKLTDLNGGAVFTFISPPVTSATNLTLTVHASKTGYLDGEGQTILTVVPKPLALTVIAEHGVLVSEETVRVFVNAKYEGSPVKDVNITVSAENGTWVSTSSVTDAYGNATFTFKAPPVPQETNITITVASWKPGYASATNYTRLTVKPGNLTVIVASSSYWVSSEEMVKLTVYVKCVDRIIPNASVTVSADMGAFSETLALTNASGCCEFSFWAPRTSETVSVAITVNAAKYGYIGVSQTVYLTVSPPSGGGAMPWLTIVLILIPVALVVVFVVLVKLGVVSVSFGGEEEEGSVS